LKAQAGFRGQIGKNAALPPTHRRRLKSTNGLERLHQEIKRRTKVVRIFPDRQSCLRLVTALCQETAEQWLTGPKYCDMSAWQEFDGDLLEWESQQPPQELIPPPGDGPAEADKAAAAD
jgi:hypothetical protein